MEDVGGEGWEGNFWHGEKRRDVEEKRMSDGGGEGKGRRIGEEKG